MIATLVHELAHELVSTVSSASIASADGDGGGSSWLLLLGPAGAAGAYFGVWRYYRNTHTSHGFEHETRIEAKPITGDDTKVSEITGTKKSGIDGDNRTNHRQRVQRID
jgi:hypothetical protein